MEVIDQSNDSIEQVEDEEARPALQRRESMGSTVEILTSNLSNAPLSLRNSLRRVGVIDPDEVNIGGKIFDTVLKTSLSVVEYAITIAFLLSSSAMHVFPWIWILIGSTKFNSGWGNLEFMVAVMAYLIMKWQPNFFGMTIFGMGYIPFLISSFMTTIGKIFIAKKYRLCGIGLFPGKLYPRCVVWIFLLDIFDVEY